MTIARRPLLIAAAIGLIALITAAFLVLDPKPDYPLDVKIVGVQTNPGSLDKTVTLQLQRTNMGAYFAPPLKYQTRIAGRWQGPVNATLVGHLFWQTNIQNIEVLVPTKADACRFLIDYQIGRNRYCTAYGYLSRWGLMHRYPKTCLKLLNLVPKGARLRHCELEVPIPA